MIVHFVFKSVDSVHPEIEVQSFHCSYFTDGHVLGTITRNHRGWIYTQKTGGAFPDIDLDRLMIRIQTRLYYH